MRFLKNRRFLKIFHFFPKIGFCLAERASFYLRAFDYVYKKNTEFRMKEVLTKRWVWLKIGKN